MNQIFQNTTPWPTLKQLLIAQKLLQLLPKKSEKFKKTEQPKQEGKYSF